MGGRGDGERMWMMEVMRMTEMMEMIGMMEEMRMMEIMEKSKPCLAGIRANVQAAGQCSFLVDSTPPIEEHLLSMSRVKFLP